MNFFKSLKSRKSKSAPNQPQVIKYNNIDKHHRQLVKYSAELSIKQPFEQLQQRKLIVVGDDSSNSTAFYEIQINNNKNNKNKIITCMTLNDVYKNEKADLKYIGINDQNAIQYLHFYITNKIQINILLYLAEFH